MNDETLTWNAVDVSSLPEKAKAAYDAYLAKNESAKQARETFERLMAKDLEAAGLTPKGTEPRFGYRWGKLAVAFGTPRVSSAKPGTITFKPGRKAR